MTKQSAEAMLSILETAHNTIATNHAQWVQNAFALAVLYPQLDDFLYQLALVKQAEVMETLSAIESRIADVKLAIEIYTMFEE